VNKYIFLPLALVTICLVGIVVYKRQTRDDARTFISRGNALNHAVSLASSNAFGHHTVALDREGKWVAEMESHLATVNTQGAPEELVHKLRADLTSLISTYASGSFDSIMAYYLSPECWIRTNVLYKTFSSLKQSEKEDWCRIDATHYSRASQERTETNNIPVKPSREILEECAYVYTNNILHLLLNEMDGRSYADVIARAGGSKLKGVEIIRLINQDLAARYRRLKSQRVEDYNAFWQDLSLDLLKVSVNRGDAQHPPVWGMNRAFLGGVQMNKPIWCSYTATPEEVYKKEAGVWYAIFQFAVRPRGLDYYGPITVLFYYNTKEGRWRLLEMACHSHIAPSVPL
jgi:hypothetical protein